MRSSGREAWSLVASVASLLVGAAVFAACGGGGGSGSSGGSGGTAGSGGTTGAAGTGGSTGDCPGGCGDNAICVDGKCQSLPDSCPCPKGAYCDLAQNKCLPGCISNDDCSSGTVCDVLNKTCVPACSSDADCPADSLCDPATSMCKGKLMLGAPCSSAAQCQSGFCVNQVCCDTACSGECQACSIAAGAATDGVCGSISPPNQDMDGDGFTGADGDCNDCNPAANPGAVEVPTGPGGLPLDEDCDGVVDEPPSPCDSGLAIDDFNAMDGAKAIDLCDTTTLQEKKPGLIEAAYVRANGQTATPSPAVGLLSAFGSNVTPRAGQRMLGLSTGRARDVNDPGACGSASCSEYGSGSPPAGIPQTVSGCPHSQEIVDDISLRVKVRAPTNATGFSFDFTFYTFDYPEWPCSSFNDQFVALLDPAIEGTIDGNTALVDFGNPVTVNTSFLQVCSGCALGSSELGGTGFGSWNDAGATSWLRTTVPLYPGSIFTVQFLIYDVGAYDVDSTTLVDNFRWTHQFVDLVTARP